MADNVNIIESKMKREKKDRKIIYAFSVNNELFEAHYCYGDKPTLTFFHNNNQFGYIYVLNIKVQYSVETETELINITGWIEKSSSSWFSIPKQEGVGIEIDGSPIENTFTDPNTHIKAGKAWLIALLIVYALKGIILTFLVDPIEGIGYIIPVLITLFFIMMYRKITKISLIGGISLAILELIDYVGGVILQFSSQKPMLILTWIILRISITWNLINAFRWLLKAKKR
jgi:hypothetical protein